MVKNKINLQAFAAGDNNDQPVRRYEKQFKELMQAVFKVQSYFGDFFGGGIEALDGIQHKDTAFSVKTSDIPVVVGAGYIEDADVAFGSGTGKSNRFGERKEIIYTDTDVKYSWGWNFHEGIDKHTVNNDFDSAVADRLDLQAQAKIKLFNRQHGAFISSVAGKVIAIEDYSAANVLKLFNNLNAYFVNIEAVGVKKAKVNTLLYNAIIDHPLSTTSKHSAADVDNNGITRFKDFEIEEVPDSMFAEGECCYAYIAGIGKAFTGIETARTIESEDFDGVALQGAGKAGEYILPDNKKAVAKAVIGAVGLDNLTVSTAAGANSGETTVTVNEDLAEGHMYKYKVAENGTLPDFGQSVKTWANWDGEADIVAATGKEIVIVECDSDYKAVKAGVAVVTAKA